MMTSSWYQSISSQLERHGAIGSKLRCRGEGQKENDEMQSEAQEIDTYTSRNENTNALVGLKDAEK